MNSGVNLDDLSNLAQELGSYGHHFSPSSETNKEEEKKKKKKENKKTEKNKKNEKKIEKEEKKKDFSTSNQRDNVKSVVSDTQQIAQDNLLKLEERGEKTKLLLNKLHELRENAKQFYETAKEMNENN